MHVHHRAQIGVLAFLCLAWPAWAQAPYFGPYNVTGNSPAQTVIYANNAGFPVTNCGATGDGSTDDTAAVQACADLHPVITFPVPKVSYKLCGLMLNSNQVLLFSGPSSLVFTASNCHAAWTPANIAPFTISAAGTGYTPGDVVTLDYTTAHGVAKTGATVNALTGSVAGVQLNALPSISNAGSGGGTPGACVLTGTTGTGTVYTVNATIGAGGTISSVNSFATNGNYTAIPSATDPITSPCGITGSPALTVSQSLSDYSPTGVSIKSPGPVMSSPPSVAMNASGGTGTGLTVTGSFVPAVFLAKDPVTAINITIDGLWASGNGGSQGGNLTEIIYLHNIGASPSQIPRHRILNTHIESTAGNALHLGYQARETFVGNYNSYKAGVSGLYVEASDSTFDDITVGQSTGINIQLTGGSGGGRLSNVKSWFAGGSTNNFAGILLNGVTAWRLTGIETQDNGGIGVDLEKSNEIYLQVVDQGANGANAGLPSVKLFKTTNSSLDVVASKSADISNQPFNAVSLSSSSNNIIRAVANNLGSFPIGGSWSGNTVILPTANNVTVPTTAAVPPAQGTVPMTSGTVTPFPMSSGTYQITGVSGSLTWANPSTGNGNTPAGLGVCFDWTQDNVGGHTISFGGNYKSPGSITTTASTRTLACFRTEDGTTWLPTAFFTGM